MLCQNCGKNEVNFRYTQIINGVKKEMALCDKCAKSLGLESLDFNMPINLSSFLGDFFHGATDTEFLPSFIKASTLQCNHCGMTYNEFIDNGKFGCSHCYDIFAEGLNNVLKNIHGSVEHIGRRSIQSKIDKEKVVQDIQNTKMEQSKSSREKKSKTDSELRKEQIEKLNRDLKLAIQEERYEEAAKIRDEIKKLSK